MLQSPEMHQCIKEISSAKVRGSLRCNIHMIMLSLHKTTVIRGCFDQVYIAAGSWSSSHVPSCPDRGGFRRCLHWGFSRHPLAQTRGPREGWRPVCGEDMGTAMQLKKKKICIFKKTKNIVSVSEGMKYIYF